jgi:hypothetical protein
MERQITRAEHGHVLTNINVWSPDGEWIVYDVRSTPDGGVFDGTRIERVRVATGVTEVLYESRFGATCGVATVCPVSGRVAFILGPERPTADYRYGPARRRGVIVDPARPGVARALDARDLTPPFTTGALRGGSHVHTFSPDGRMVAFTYDDDVLSGRLPAQRNVGVSLLDRPTTVPRAHPRNHDGHFSVLISRTTASPRPGTDDIGRAFEDGWVGTNGYVRADGRRQKAIAFQGEVCRSDGTRAFEVFLADLPDDLTRPGVGPLEGSDAEYPSPPAGVIQRRLTVSPGLSGPRHWLRSSPDGERIAFIMRDSRGLDQLWSVSPRGGPPALMSSFDQPVTSCFSWSPCGQFIACGVGRQVMVQDVETNTSHAVTSGQYAPRPEACVFSPTGDRIAFASEVGGWNQVFVVDVPVRLRERPRERRQTRP